MTRQDFRGKVVLVTGSSSGIGAGAAVEFARRGASVSLTGRNLDRLSMVARECASAGRGEQFVLQTAGDITNEHDIEKVVEATINYFGTINVLVNNAGGTRVRTFSELHEDDLQYVLDLNVRSTFLFTRLAASEIVKNKGCIVNVSSVAGIKPSPATFAYSIAKATVDQFGRALAMELGPKGVRVTTINPGHTTDTRIFTGPNGVLQSLGKTEEEYFGPYMKYYPLGRMGRIKDVAPAIVFLASEDASFVTGINLPIDGGYCASPDIVIGSTKVNPLIN